MNICIQVLHLTSCLRKVKILPIFSEDMCGKARNNKHESYNSNSRANFTGRLILDVTSQPNFDLLCPRNGKHKIWYGYWPYKRIPEYLLLQKFDVSHRLFLGTCRTAASNDKYAYDDGHHNYKTDNEDGEVVKHLIGFLDIWEELDVRKVRFPKLDDTSRVENVEFNHFLELYQVLIGVGRKWYIVDSQIAHDLHGKKQSP